MEELQLDNKRENFSGKLGFILACAGAAIGLGNVWMFSWRLGQYGGAAFLIPYFIFLFILGIPGLIGEIALGRAMKKGAFGFITETFNEKKLKGGNILGIIPLAAVTGILVFYVVVEGWIFRYFVSSLTNCFTKVQIPSYFEEFAGTSHSVIWTSMAILVTVAIVIIGVSKGIERINKIVMPSLLVLFVILLIRSVTLPGAMEGVKYLLIPDWSYLLKPITWVMALGQAFFSVSLNGAGMVVYGSYLKKDMDIPFASINTAIFDTVAALLAAFIIIPAAFAFGLDPTSGPPLLFITIPSIFTKMPGGYIFSILFFLSIVFAAISSSINMMEVPVETIISKFKVGRTKSTLLIGAVALIAAIPLSVSMELFGKWADFMTIYLSPIGAVISAVVFYWIYGEDKVLEEVNMGAKTHLGKWFVFIGKYVYVFVAIIIIIFGAIYGGI